MVLSFPLKVKRYKPQTHFLIIADSRNDEPSVLFFGSVRVEATSIDETGVKKLTNKILPIILSIV